MKTNGIKAWFLAARPKTLTGAAAPVIMAGACAVQAKGALDVLPFVLCLLFAFVMQVDSNFVNDYFDFRKGTDREDRLGPERACAQGWVTPGAMRIAIGVTTVLACLLGLPLIFWGGAALVAVGALCVLFCFLYTTCLSYLGYGDLLVLVFFGVVPVCVTYYVVTGDMNWPVLLAGIACGLATDCLLMVNNYRDRNEDAVSGKRTLVVRFGSSFGLSMYLWLGVLAFLLGAVSLVAATGNWYAVLPLLLYALSHIVVYRKMRIIDGRALNGILGATARNIILFSLLYGLGLLLM
jgi:1,4-dihydroxy-2-naphthoate octaprenyltransferase